MSFWASLFGNTGGGIIKAVGDVVDSVTTTDEERMELENEMAKTRMNFQLENRRLDVHEQELHVQDTASARAMQAEIQESEHANVLAKMVGPALAVGAPLLTFVLFYMVLFKTSSITQDQKDLILYILGVLSAICTQIFSFYFGSSQGSRDKHRLIERIHHRNPEQK